jgi:hypothetical protein
LTIVTHSGDPRNIPRSEDDLLAEEIGLIDPTQEVRVSRYETKDFMPLADILTVWIPNQLAGWALGKTASAAAGWVRRRIREGKERPGWSDGRNPIGGWRGPAGYPCLRRIQRAG